MMQSYWYLATPYSRYPFGVDAAFNLACRQTSLLYRAGVRVFSPIIQSHSLVSWGLHDFKHQDWLDADQPMIDQARGVIALCARGWDQSDGMIYEMAECVRAGKPMHMMEPGKVPDVLVAEAEWRRGVAEKTNGNVDALAYFDDFMRAWSDPQLANEAAITAWLAE